MPEGDTIRRLAAEVAQRFQGATISRSTFRHPQLANLDLTGRTLESTDAVGKHLLLRFDDERSLRVHLLMDGRVRYGSAPGIEPWRRRFELDFADPPGGRMIGVDIPKLDLLRTEDEGRMLEHLGPDVCGAYDHAAGIERLAGMGDTPLGGALLDQRVVAGLGNIYAVESPFVCGLSPFAPVRGITDPQRILAVAVALIRTNAHRGPQNTTGRNMRSTEHWVLSGNRRHCPVCDTRLERVHGDRSPWNRRTAWCPSCQRDEGAVDVERVRRLLALHPALRMLDDDLALVADTSEPVVPYRSP